MIDATTNDAPTAPSPRFMSALGAVPRRLVAIAVLAGLTLVPIAMIAGLVGDRESRENDVQRALTRSWGPAQALESPILAIPVPDAHGAPTYLEVAPKTLAVKVTLTPERRHRGIFAATVYTAAIEMSGTFALPPREPHVGAADGVADLAGSVVTLPVSRLDGVEADDALRVGDAKTPWQLCVDRVSVASCRDAAVLVAPLDAAVSKGGEIAFAATLHLRGTQALSLALAGKQVTATIAGAWPSPSFNGSLLPAETRSDGRTFEARWRHDEIGRPHIATSGTVVEAQPAGGTIGVDLIEPTPVYRMIERTTKYALLVIVLAFTTYYLLELVAGVRVTLLHYGLLGASLSLFTLLLLSVSELVGYPAGYALSALLVVTQASLYSASVARRTRPALVFAGTLAGLFAFLYVLLGLESYALVVGAVALFILLSIVMAATQSLAPATAP